MARSCYLEDEVEQALKRGVYQYVILGAGLDSFAYRRRDLATLVHIFEIDHPATQAWKRGRLHDLAIEIPANLSLVPVDFETQSLIENLRQRGYQTDIPGFFSWLGVIPYLTSEAIFSTFRTVAILAPGTEIIFEYAVPKRMLDEESQKFLDVLIAAGEDRGEPLRSFFEPDRLADDVCELGFGEVSHFWS